VFESQSARQFHQRYLGPRQRLLIREDLEFDEVSHVPHFIDGDFDRRFMPDAAADAAAFAHRGHRAETKRLEQLAVGRRTLDTAAQWKLDFPTSLRRRIDLGAFVRNEVLRANAAYA